MLSTSSYLQKSDEIGPPIVTTCTVYLSKDANVLIWTEPVPIETFKN
jgi:hypothetical protein